MEAVEKQDYRFKLPAKWRIHPVFHTSLLKKDVTTKEVVNDEIANQFKFEEVEQPEQEVDLIVDSMVFAKKAIDGRLPGL